MHIPKTLQHWHYRDPQYVLERKQETAIAKSCSGCVHLIEHDVFDAISAYCQRGKEKLHRCNLYDKSTGECMFADTDKALHWAFTVASTPIVKLSSINKMCWRPSPGTRNDLLINLSQSEALEQAQQIVGVAVHLHDKSYTEYIYARYSNVLDTKQTETMMTRIFAALGTATTNRRGIWKIVLKYFGRNIKQSEIRESLRCDRNKVPIIISKVYSVLDYMHSHALAEMDEKLREKGVVG